MGMDTQRLILFFTFTFSLFLLLDAWQRDRQGEVAPPAESSAPVAEAPAKRATQSTEVPVPGKKLVEVQGAVP
jgi:YidC/Oxa1 family membrane protein insertase